MNLIGQFSRLVRRMYGVTVILMIVIACYRSVVLLIPCDSADLNDQLLFSHLSMR